MTTSIKNDYRDPSPLLSSFVGSIVGGIENQIPMRGLSRILVEELFRVKAPSLFSAAIVGGTVAGLVSLPWEIYQNIDAVRKGERSIDEAVLDGALDVGIATLMGAAGGAFHARFIPLGVTSVILMVGLLEVGILVLEQGKDYCLQRMFSSLD